MSNIIQLRNAAKIHGSDGDIVAEVVTITPVMATSWLRCNKVNRPVRKQHVVFLASEILSGNWQVNGQAIVIAENENVLDGQHRLMAIIEAGVPIQSLVVYGISESAFSTIDTGAVRTGADALCLHFHEYTQSVVKAVATACQWLPPLERGSVRRVRISNTDVILYAQQHLSMFSHAETLLHYPKDNRPIPAGIGTALYELFARKDEDKADSFFHSLFTGEDLTRDDVEWHLRQAFQKDAQRVTTKLPMVVRMRMVIKGWNWRRRGMPTASPQTIVISANDDQRITVL